MAKTQKKRAIIYSNVKENKKRAEELEKIRNDQIDLSNEFIIGLNDFSGSKAQKNNKNTSKNKEKIKKQKNKKRNNNNKSQVNKKKKVKRKMNPKIKKKIIAFFISIIVVVVLIVGIIAFIRSSIFNIKQISVKIENNKVITESKIIDLSEIIVGQNIYSIKKNDIIKNVKRDPYVESVKVKRCLPNKFEIKIEERSVKFQIEADGQYIYIDNQGYILEQNTNPQDCIILKGNIASELTPGNRLEKADLDKLSDVLKILQEAENNEIRNLISSIDITDKNDYLINFDTIGKIAHIGNISSINDKMTYVKKILDVESNYEGEIFVNVDLNKGEYPYFREKV